MHVKSNLDFIQIGLRVREIRKAAHLKPGEFGEIVGVGDKHISNVESPISQALITGTRCQHL